VAREPIYGDACITFIPSVSDSDCDLLLR